MPSHTAVRGLRRAELVAREPATSIEFHRSLLDWMVLQSDSGLDCWVGERRCATVREPKAGEPSGWRLLFAGGDQDGELTGPEDVAATVVNGRAQHGPWAPSPRRGEPCWVELHTREAERADAFWTETLTWKGAEDTAGVTYTVEDRPIASRTSPRSRECTGWLCYFTVPSLERAAEQVEELGGTILEQFAHPVLGQALILTDGNGAVSALTGKTETWGG